MAEIRVLAKETIDLIAAGEVIERPSSVVKELVENAIDAGATAITVEIKDGGMELIRVTDNGCGIEKSQVPLAFCSHATSKIRTAADLDDIFTLGFRGEALSSIAAVARVEMITKTGDALLGTRYVIEGAKEVSLEEIGAPNGTTFLVRQLFFHTPARRKFLKTPQTEAGYIHTLLQHMALSHPDIAFQFLSHGQTKLYTSGNDSAEEIIYHLYGKEIASSLIPVHAVSGSMKLTGFIGKPIVTRGNRNYENYFVNGRYVKSDLIAKGIEDAYRTYLMQHQYPFTVLSFTVDGHDVDVNVHPQKLELRFSKSEELYRFLSESIRDSLQKTELIPEVPFGKEALAETQKPEAVAPLHDELSKFDRSDASEPEQPSHTEPFEEARLMRLKESIRAQIAEDSPYEPKYDQRDAKSFVPQQKQEQPSFEQQILPFFTEETKQQYRILGQAFATYWLVEMGEELFLVDQHAAHEKVIFERLMKRKEEKEPLCQQIAPPMVLSLSTAEEETLKRYREDFTHLGYEIDHFGGSEYRITAIPADIYGLNERQLFLEMLDDLTENERLRDTDALYLKIATMSCKAAIKGNMAISTKEFQALFDEMLTLDNPYHCPHGRPTTIRMSRVDLERKFKRVL